MKARYKAIFYHPDGTKSRYEPVYGTNYDRTIETAQKKLSRLGASSHSFDVLERKGATWSRILTGARAL